MGVETVLREPGCEEGSGEGAGCRVGEEGMGCGGFVEGAVEGLEVGC